LSAPGKWGKKSQWPATNYWANLVRADILANAAVGNIRITSGCPSFARNRRRATWNCQHFGLGNRFVQIR
jgi:hypothetical protein